MDIKFGFQPPSKGPQSPAEATEPTGVGVGQGAENFSAELLSAGSPIGLAQFTTEVDPGYTGRSGFKPAQPGDTPGQLVPELTKAA